MNITPITAAEFPQIARNGAGRQLSPLGKVIRALVVGEGFCMPCEWPHATKALRNGYRNGCPGTMKVHAVIRQIEGHFKTRCVDGTFYVLRTE